MVQTPEMIAGKRLEKLSRAERNEATKRRLFDAATKVVGKFGYAEASVARITEMAGVAQGTFYNHFENRQALLDQLLPTIGIDMVHFIRNRVGMGNSAAQRELDGFRAFFEFVHHVPEFQRILNEAEFFAPAGYQKHLDNISTAFVRILKRARTAGEIADYSDEEFEAIVHMFMGARGYLSRRYAYSEGAVTSVPDDVLTAYKKLITRGLFKPRNRDDKA
jgi:AcrR family transcriptional regulator